MCRVVCTAAGKGSFFFLPKQKKFESGTKVWATAGLKLNVAIVKDIKVSRAKTWPPCSSFVLATTVVLPFQTCCYSRPPAESSQKENLWPCDVTDGRISRCTM